MLNIKDTFQCLDRNWHPESGSMANVWGKCEIMAVSVIVPSTDSFCGEILPHLTPLVSYFLSLKLSQFPKLNKSKTPSYCKGC